MRVARAREAAAAMLADWPAADREQFLRSAIPATGSPSIPRRMPATPRLIRDAEARQAPLTVERSRCRNARGDRGDGLCRRPSPGCSAGSPARWRSPAPRIVDARIHTLTNGMALDTFWIQDAAGGAFDAPHRLARLSVLIEQSLSGRLRLADGDPQGVEGDARPAHARDPRAAARGDRQPRLQHPHRDRGERPRPARACCTT